MHRRLIILKGWINIIVLIYLLHIIFTDTGKLLGHNPACKITTDEKHTEGLQKWGIPDCLICLRILTYLCVYYYVENWSAM